MATTSIWRVKGWLGKVLIYVENPDKTENPAAFEKQGMDGQEAQGLSDVIEYAARQEKTGRIAPDEEGAPVMQRFVSGVNCSPSTARDEMMAVKKRFGKEDGTVAYHGYQSFAPGEATPELAHEIGLALAKKLWGEKYQVLVATHLDKAHHLHNHFVVNTVSFVDGIKYYRSEKDYFAMQRESDRLCREYGLSVIENPQRGKSKHYGEWRAEQEGRPTYLSLIKADVDAAIRQSMTERQFFLSSAADGLRHQGGQGHYGAPLRPAPRQETCAQLWRGLFPGEHPQADSGPEPPPAGTNAGAETVQAPRGLETGQKGDGVPRSLLPLLLPAGGVPQKAEPPDGPCAPRAAGGFDPGRGTYRRGAAAFPPPY